MIVVDVARRRVAAPHRTRRRRAGRPRRVRATVSASLPPRRASSASPAEWPKRVVVGLEAVEVEHHQAATAISRGSVRCHQRRDVGEQLAPVAEAGERVGYRLGSRSSWWARMSAAAARAFSISARQQPRSRRRRSGGRAAPGTGSRRSSSDRRDDGKRQRQRPASIVLDLLGGVRRRRRPGRRAQGGRRPVGGWGIELVRRPRSRSARSCRRRRRALRLTPRKTISSSASRSSLDAKASPRRRTADCRRLRSCSNKLEPLVGLLDPGAAVARQHQQQRSKRQHEQHRAEPVFRRDRGQQTHRRQTRVDDPHQRDHLHLDARGHAGRDRLAQRRRGQVQKSAGHERDRQQRQVVKPERRGAGSQQHRGRADRVPAVGDREQQTLGRLRQRAKSHSAPSISPATASSGTVAGGSSTSIGTSTSWVGTTWPAPTGNSTRATRAYIATRSAATAGEKPAVAPGSASSPPAAARNSAPAANSAASSRREGRSPRASHESSSSRSAVPAPCGWSVVLSSTGVGFPFALSACDTGQRRHRRSATAWRPCPRP